MPSEYMLRARAVIVLCVLVLVLTVHCAFADMVAVCESGTAGAPATSCSAYGYVDSSYLVGGLVSGCVGGYCTGGSAENVLVEVPASSGDYVWSRDAYDFVGVDSLVWGSGSGSSSSSSSSASSQDSGVGPFPVLSESDGYQIAYAVLLLWGVAYGLLQIRRALKR